MEFVRKGKASKDPAQWNEYAEELRKYNIPEWYIKSCQKIKYMFPKAHAAAYVMSAIRLGWFKVHEPIVFYCAYFSAAPDGFDGLTAAKGKSAVRKLLDEIKNKIVPALDDSFAKDMGFETLDALKAKVKESLDEEAKQNARRDEISQIENHLVKMNNFDLPQSLVEEYTESSLNNFVRSMTQLKPEQLTADQKKAFEERIRPSVEKDLRIGYIVHAIAKKENLEATEADWKAELDKSIAANSQNKEDEKKIKAFFEERKAHILATLSERKVFDFLKEQAKYK